MNYVLLKCGKNDYMIVNENEWKEFNKRKNGIPKKDRKDRSYKIADRVFLLKETKKIKNIFSGSYVDMYKLMPEIVIANTDYKELTNEILLYLENTPGRKWDFVLYFASDFTYSNFKSDEYDFYFEALKKYEFIKLFENEDISKVQLPDYMLLVEIALKARYDDKNAAIDMILGDERFELPKNFDIHYSSEMEFDENLRFIKNKEIIKDFFLNNRRGLHRFLANPNPYTPEIVSVLTDINPLIYSVDDNISRMSFCELYQIRKNKSVMGYLDVNSASNNLVLRMRKMSDEMIERDFTDPYKKPELVTETSEALIPYAENVIEGIVAVPELFNRGAAKKILDCLGDITKCETIKDKSVILLNKAISQFSCGKYDEENLKNIFSDWVEEWSVDFKRIVKYISDDNIDFIKKYISKAECEVLDNNR